MYSVKLKFLQLLIYELMIGKKRKEEEHILLKNEYI